MGDKLIEKISEMLECLSVNEPPEAALERINQLFISFSEELQLMENEEREARRGETIEAQRVFHNAGLSIIERLEGQSQTPQQEQSAMVIDEQQVSANEMQLVSPGQTVSEQIALEPATGERQTIPLIANEEEEAWGGQEQEASEKGNSDVSDSQTKESKACESEPKRVHLPFLDFEALFRPLFEIQQMSQVDKMALNRLLTVLLDMREKAESLNFPLEQERQAIISLIQNRLDYVSRSLWMWQMDRGEPTIEQLMNFLVKRSNRIEVHERPSTSGQAQGAIPRRSVSSKGAVQRLSSSVSVGSATAEQPSISTGKKHKPVCIECQGEHFLHKCDRFKSMTMGQKRAILNYHRLCHNCFSATHTTSQCKQGACKRCGTKHNSILCTMPKEKKGEN